MVLINCGNFEMSGVSISQ